MCVCVCVWAEGSVVGIATRYGLDGTGIQSRWGRDSPHPSRPATGLTEPPIQWILLIERIELYLCFLSGHAWPVLS